MEKLTKEKKEVVELRKIKKGKLFKLPTFDYLFVRDEYSCITKTFIFHKYGEIGNYFRLDGRTLVFPADNLD